MFSKASFFWALPLMQHAQKIEKQSVADIKFDDLPPTPDEHATQTPAAAPRDPVLPHPQRKIPYYG